MSGSTYTVSDVKEADRLWDRMPLPKVSSQTGIPKSTLKNWSAEALISTDTDHRTKALRKYDDETIDRADHLWDAFPLCDVAEILDLPYGTLLKWSEKGWISTDTDHRGNYQQEGMKETVHRAAYLANETDLTNRASAAKMGVAESTFYRYLRLYRKR